MHYIGIDVSKADFYASLGSVTRKFANTPKGFSAFMCALRKEGCVPAETQIGTEATCAAALIAGIGDIRRFPGPEQLVAYLGLDCRVHESGSSVHGKGYLTKRGNAYLRHLLYLAALVGKRHIPELETYYRKKLSEGRHHTSALCAAERKLIHIIFAVWTRGTPFVRRAHTKTPGETSPGVDKAT